MAVKGCAVLGLLLCQSLARTERPRFMLCFFFSGFAEIYAHLQKLLHFEACKIGCKLCKCRE